MNHSPFIFPGGKVFVDSTLIDRKAQRTDIETYYVPATQMAADAGKRLTVKEWKTTPDGKNSWVDHIEVYNEKGQLIGEAEYSDFGRHLAWRSEYEYNAEGQLIKEVVYNERDKVSKVRKFEYDSNGVCTRRLNYNANGTLNSYRKFEYIYE